MVSVHASELAMGRASFLLLVPGAAFGLAGGCFAGPDDGGHVSTDGTGGTSEPSCPDEVPAAGAPCSEAETDLYCGHLGLCDVWEDPPARMVVCTGRIWDQLRVECSEPCPLRTPLPGSSCVTYPTNAVCGIGSCDEPRPVVCNALGLWVALATDCPPLGMGGLGGTAALGGAGGVDGS
jgi:hypothetical protein